MWIDQSVSTTVNGYLGDGDRGSGAGDLRPRGQERHGGAHQDRLRWETGGVQWCRPTPGYYMSCQWVTVVRLQEIVCRSSYKIVEK